MFPPPGFLAFVDWRWCGSLLRLMRKERGLISALTSLGLTPGDAVALVTHPALAAAQARGAGAAVLDGIFDASDRPEGGRAITWWNDLTKDARYQRWNPSITGVRLSFRMC